MIKEIKMGGMIVNIRNLGLLNVLANILNGDESTSEFAITEYLISRIDDICQVSVNEIVDNAHVSRSSIRRYCNLLGYDNFSEFKDSFSVISFPSNIHLRSFNGVDFYRENLNTGIERMFLEINNAVDNKIIEDLTEKMHYYENVLIFSANNTSSNLLKFQQELLYVKKIVKLIDFNLYHEQVEELVCDETLLIVVSVSGLYAEAISKELDKLKAEKILITANKNDQISKFFDQVVYLSERDVRNDNLGLLGKYGVTYFFDLVSENYIFNYKRWFKK